MVRLREITRTAAFAWSSGTSKPLLVTGTRAGAISDDFATETKLELWDLDLDNQRQGAELQPIVSIDVDSRFNDIAWGPAPSKQSEGSVVGALGLIIGALESGAVVVYDAAKLVAGDAEGALIATTTKHSGAVKSVQVNHVKPQLFASAGEKGELFVYDVSDVNNPVRLSHPGSRPEDLECVAWNRKVSNILATGSAGGFVSIWDIKKIKLSLTLNNRKPVSAIAWDPTNSTKLLTATSDDSEPRILLWNLRQSKEPEQVLSGHLQGVLSLSWCDQDCDVLVSSGKDAKTIVWNPQTGQKLGELPEVTNWAFLTRFHPQKPNLLATASFDGKVVVQSMQTTNADTSDTSALNNMDDADFFSNVEPQPQASAFCLPSAPKWCERPIGASFGFGGKLVVFRAAGADNGRQSKVQIVSVTADDEVASSSRRFVDSMQAGDIKKICDEHRDRAKTDDEKADWVVMGTLVAQDQRSQITQYLGFSSSTDSKTGDVDDDDDATLENDELKQDTKDAAPGSQKPVEKQQHGLAHAFADEGDDEFPSAFDTDADDLHAGVPFTLMDSKASADDQQITKAIVLGDFAKATDICLRGKRYADAFLFANCGPKELVDKVQTAYLAHQEGSPSYLRVIGSVVQNNLKDVVVNANLDQWKEVMATLCTFAKPDEFPRLCTSLGDRIFESGSRKDASFCYLVGSKLEKVVDIWLSELRDAEQTGIKEPEGDSTFSVHARTLQDFIEKVTVFRHVAKFQDPDLNKESDWKLAPLYDKYIEYADIVASHGLLNVAQQYLDLLPTKYPAAEMLQKRVQQAMQKPAKSTANTKAAQAPRKSLSGYPSMVNNAPRGPSLALGSPAATLPPPPHPPAAAAAASGPTNNNMAYVPPMHAGLMAPGNNNNNNNNNTIPNRGYQQQPAPYASQQSYMPQQSYTPPTYGANQPPPAGFAPHQALSGPPLAGGPPRSQTPSGGSAAKKEADSWNDAPMVARKSRPPRRGTPSVVPGPAGNSAPPTSAFNMPPTGHGVLPPPPPPKASAMGGVSSPPPTVNPVSRPSSTVNMYAPPPPSTSQPGSMVHPPGMRTASPYNPPPSAAPPTNRYAPAAAPAGSYNPSPYGQPPGGRYGAPPAAQYGTAVPGAPPMGGPPMGGPPMGGPPMGGMSRPPMGGPPLGGPPMAAPPMAAPPMAGPPRAGPPREFGGIATPPPSHAPPSVAASHASPMSAVGSPASEQSNKQVPPQAQKMVQIFMEECKTILRADLGQFEKHAQDMEKRLEILYNHLKNEDLVKPDTISELTELAEALSAKDYSKALAIQENIQKTKADQCGAWMVGVKRLIKMRKGMVTA